MVISGSFKIWLLKEILIDDHCKTWIRILWRLWKARSSRKVSWLTAAVPIVVLCAFLTTITLEPLTALVTSVSLVTVSTVTSGVVHDRFTGGAIETVSWILLTFVVICMKFKVHHSLNFYYRRPTKLWEGNVTGPPGALLFDRDQRSHWKNHFNCCFVRVAAWAFITQISCHRC